MDVKSWEQRYAEVKQLFATEPSELLLANKDNLHADLSALAVGDGEGRNGVWLAQQGLAVTSIDLSETALKRAQALARRHKVSITTICQDFLHWQWPVAHFDVITCIFIHLPAELRQQLHHFIWQALKPGGILLIEGFHIGQIQMDTGGPTDPAMLLSEDILQRDFSAANILSLQQVPTQVTINGQYKGEGLAVHFVARKDTTAPVNC